MKKLLFIGVLFVLASCSKEETTFITESEVNLSSEVYKNSNIGVYNGVFTTLDSEKRALVEVNVVDGSTFSSIYTPYSSVKLTFENGEQIIAFAEKTLNAEEDIIDLRFEAGQLSLNFSVEADGKNPTIDDVVFNNNESAILIAKHTERAPVVPINGTYSCDECGSHPVLDNTITQTFNIMFVGSATGDDSVMTQAVLGGNTFNGIGIQSNCIDFGSITSCLVDSGDSSSEIGFMAGGAPVTWGANHVYGNGANNCSEVSGDWSWDTINYGIISGTFEGTGNTGSCITTAAIEDFDSSTPAWPYTTSIPFFIDNEDSFSPTDGSAQGASNIDNNGNFSGNFLFVRDLANNNGGTAVSEAAILTFSNITIASTETAVVSFDYDVIGYDSGDDVDYILVVDGVDQPSVVLIDGINGGGTSAFGKEFIQVPAGTTSVGLKLLIKQNGGSDYAGFDNFTLEKS